MLQAEFYMSLEEWSKAEMTLQKILKTVDSEHEVALYQLSQVYLEQNQTGSALEAIRAASKNGCKNAYISHKEEILQPLSEKCIWGPKCTPKAHLCAQIVIQEADILRARRQYQMAAQVRNNIAYWLFFSWEQIFSSGIVLFCTSIFGMQYQTHTIDTVGFGQKLGQIFRCFKIDSFRSGFEIVRIFQWTTNSKVGKI